MLGGAPARRPLLSDALAPRRGVGDGSRKRVSVARLVEPEAAHAAHVSEIDEYEPVFGHVTPQTDCPHLSCIMSALADRFAVLVLVLVENNSEDRIGRYTYDRRDDQHQQELAHGWESLFNQAQHMPVA